jgi:hypothetical protein
VDTRQEVIKARGSPALIELAFRGRAWLSHCGLSACTGLRIDRDTGASVGWDFDLPKAGLQTKSSTISVGFEIDVRSRYGHILVIAYGLVAGPGTRRYMVWISRADPGPGLDPSGLLSFRHKRPSSISTDCIRRLPAQRSLG